MKGQRGELYGDLVGRLLGGAAGWKAGKTLSGKSGEALGRVIGIGMGQAAGGRVGKQVGREVDAARVKRASALDMSKLALEDEMQASQFEQQAEQAEMANSARFYMERAKQHADAKAQLESELTSAQQKMQESDATIQQLQQTMQANSEAASQSTTAALLQSVQANTQAIQQRQLAADATNTNMTLRDQLRQLADGPSGGAPEGPGNIEGQIQGPSGGPTSGNGQKELQDGPGNAPPAGESNAYQPIDTQQSGQAPPMVGGAGNLAKAAPGLTVSLAGDGRQPSTPSAYADGGKGKMGSVKIPEEMKSKLKSMGFGAAAGAGLFGVDKALETHKGTKDLHAKKRELEGKPAGYRKDVALAGVKSDISRREIAGKHPVKSTLSAMVPGAVVGSAVGPAVHAAGKRVIENIKKLKK